MSGPNAPAAMSLLPKILPMNQTAKPLGADRVPQSAPMPRVTNTRVAPAPEPMAGPVPMPRPRPVADDGSFASRFGMAEGDLQAAGNPMVRAIGQRMIAGGLPQRTGPSRDELLMEARGKLAQLMAGQAQNPPVEPQRMAPARGAPTTGSQQIGPTEYAPDFTAKLDKKGRPRDVPLKSNTDAKGSNLNIYAALGIDPSEGARGIEPKIQKLLKIQREEPWRLTRAQDKILSSIADEDATHRSIDPRDVEARFKGYEFKRQEAEAEEEQEAYEKTAGKREKLQGQQQRAQERKVERERKKAEKENAKAKAEGRAPADMDPAVAKAMAALEAKGVPTWQGKKAPTQADVNAQQDAPDDFAARFPNYKAPAPQATETEDEGEE